MKKYIYNNLAPFLLGFSIAYVVLSVIDTIADIIIKLALIKQ